MFSIAESGLHCRLCTCSAFAKLVWSPLRSNMFRAFTPFEDIKSKNRERNYIKSPEQRGYELSLKPQPREERMPLDQDWTSVWPTAQVFKPSVVPLPIRMGRGAGWGMKNVPLSKYANVELLKINNFLHLTPPAVEKHCNAIKKFMTKWPEELRVTDVREEFLPIEVTTSDFCFSGPAVRHPDSRVCTLRIKLANLKLDERARNKMILLLEDRYDKETDMMTIVTDRCPTRKQNRDYALYLLNVLYHESQKVQPFEASKSELDDEKFIWTRSGAKQYLEEYLQRSNISSDQWENENVEKLVQTVAAVVDEGETELNMQEFKSANLDLLGLKPLKIDDDSESAAKTD